MKILVTGSSGMIGTGLSLGLINDYDVVGIDKVRNTWDKQVNKKTIIHDLTQGSLFPYPKMYNNTDIAVLLAANARVYELVKHPYLAKENIDILFNSLEFCRQNDISKVIFASSREVYGNKKQEVFSEEDNMIQDCESPYTASKIGGEALIHAYQKCYGIDYIILRYSNVYGRYDDSTRLIPTLIRQMRQNKNVRLWGPSKKLDFTYLDDAIDCTIRCISNFGVAKNNIFNVASGQGTTIKDISMMIKILLKSNSRIVEKESHVGEITHYVADLSKARIELGYEPKTYITEGINKSLEWYNDYY